MCTPSLAVGGLVGLANYAAGSQAADYTKSLAIQQRDAATDAYNFDTAQLGLQDQQRQAQSAQSMAATNQEVARQQAAALTSAGESGSVGLSLNSLLADYYRQGAGERETSRYNEQIAGQQSQVDRERLQTTAASRINTAYSGIQGKPNLGLSIASGVIGGM